jgi:hypothetical protein
MNRQEFEKQIKFFDDSKFAFIRNLIYSRCVEYLNKNEIKNSLIFSGFTIQLDDYKEIFIAYGHKNKMETYFVLEYCDVYCYVDLFTYDELFDENTFIKKIKKMISFYNLQEKKQC